MAKNRTRFSTAVKYFFKLSSAHRNCEAQHLFIVLIYLQLFWFSAEQQKTKGQDLLNVLYLKAIQF